MRNGPQHNSLISAYFIHHARVLLGSLGHLTRHPLSTSMTMAVIAIALTLPAGLYLALNNISGLSAGWDSSTKISLFLHAKVNKKKAQTLVKRLRLHNEIDSISMISKEQGLEQFKQLSGFGDALQFLEGNPLPIVLVVQPIINASQPNQIKQLLKELESDRLVDIAQLDMQWVKRLYALLEIAHRVIWAIGGLLGLAVLLIVGNTIRLDIQNRRSEIEVSKLIGASNAFIRRPFLYTGFWYGFSGGVLAWLLTTLSLFMLAEPVENLALLYHSDFELSGLSFGDTGSLIMISCSLGLFGSWLAVGRHLDEIEPS